MPGLTGPIIATTGDIFSSSATQSHQFGTLAQTRDGRRFRYCKAGASALVVGNVIQGPAAIANHLDLTPTVTTYGAIGDTKMALTTAATAGAANLYAEGWACVSTTPGIGYMYPISTHPAIAGSDLVTFTLQSDSPIQVALTGSSRVGLHHNPYKNVIQAPVTTLTGAVVGVAVYPIPATEYGWVQVSGPSGVLCAGAIGVGLAAVVPSTAAGAVIVDGAAAETPVIGTMLSPGVNAKVIPIMLGIN